MRELYRDGRCRVCGAAHEGTATFATKHWSSCPFTRALDVFAPEERETQARRLYVIIDRVEARLAEAAARPTSDNYLCLVSDRPEDREGVMVGHVIMRADEHRHTVEAMCERRFSDFFTLSQHFSPSVRQCALCVARRNEEMARTELVRETTKRLDCERNFQSILKMLKGPDADWGSSSPYDVVHLVGAVVRDFDALRAAGPNAEMLAFVRTAAQQLLSTLESHCESIIRGASTPHALRDQVRGFKAWLEAGGIENRTPHVGMKREAPLQIRNLLSAIDDYTRVMTRKPKEGETYEGILESAEHWRKNLCAAAIVLGSTRAAARAAIDNERVAHTTDALVAAAEDKS